MLSIVLFLFSFIIVLSQINESNGVLCPPPSATPCICNTTTKEIKCRGSYIKLDEVFQELIEFIPERERDFDSLYLNIRGLTTLEANTFKGIRFQTVFLGGSKLTYLHKDAFLGTQYHVKELYVFATNLSIGDKQEYNLFESISSLTNLQRLVISGSNINHIPDRAFMPRNETNIQKNLTEIELGFGIMSTIQSIGFASFANLPALESLSFSNQRISHIKFNAFSFYESSNKTLTIDLTENNLNDSSFETGSFLGANRPLKIHFGLNGCNNNMTFLNQTVFEPFLDENLLNSIDVGRGCNNMICDCRMDWILSANYNERIKNLKCRDGLSLKKSKDRLNKTISKCEPDLNNEFKKIIISTQTTSTVEEKTEAEDYYEENDQFINLCSSDVCVGTAMEMTKHLNDSIDPCNNFYDFACGHWEDSHFHEYLTHKLTNGGTEYDQFVKLRLQVDKNLDSILSKTSNDKELNIIEQTINMYQNCKENESPNLNLLMDIINEIGGWPIVSKLNDDYKWQNALVIIFAKIRRDIIITLDSTINEDSVKQLKITHSSFILSQSKLMNRKRKSTVRHISSYIEYIHDVAVMLGAQESGPQSNDTFDAAYDIVKFESELAKISDQSSGQEFFLERDLNSIKCLIPEIDWIEIFTNILNYHDLNLEDFSKTSAILDIHYLVRISKLLQKTDPIVIANYLGWRVVETFGFLLGGNKFLEYQEIFHSTQSNEKTKELWKQCLNPLKSFLSMALTRKYAETYLTESDKLEVIQIVKSVKQSFISLIDQKEWLGDKKVDFIAKSEETLENVGYPDWIFDDNQLSDYYQNLTMRMSEKDEFPDFYRNLWIYSTNKYLKSIGKKVNKTHEWDRSPLYVGASYDIVNNIIIIPIGILQPPFYDSRRPAYLNFGSIGSFYGHEISHGSMPLYDNDETLFEPWDDILLKSFLSKAKCFVDQYSAYYDEEAEQNLDGLKTFEEDIGDIAGLKASFKAYNNHVKQNENQIDDSIKLLPIFPQYSDKQLFFLSYAQKWCRYISGSQVRIKIMRGVHSPEKYRVNGALSNFDEFSKAFDCPLGSAMNPETKCEMW